MRGGGKHVVQHVDTTEVREVGDVIEFAEQILVEGNVVLPDVIDVLVSELQQHNDVAV